MTTITFANQFEASANIDGTCRITFRAADMVPPATTAVIYMTHADAVALAGLLTQIIEKQGRKTN